MTDIEIEQLAELIEKIVRSVIADISPNLKFADTKSIQEARVELKSGLKTVFAAKSEPIL
jgi:hypothetical protein